MFDWLWKLFTRPEAPRSDSGFSYSSVSTVTVTLNGERLEGEEAERVAETVHRHTDEMFEHAGRMFDAANRMFDDLGNEGAKKK